MALGERYAGTAGTGPDPTELLWLCRYPRTRPEQMKERIEMAFIKSPQSLIPLSRCTDRQRERGWGEDKTDRRGESPEEKEKSEKVDEITKTNRWATQREWGSRKEQLCSFFCYWHHSFLCPISRSRAPHGFSPARSLFCSFGIFLFPLSAWRDLPGARSLTRGH